MKNVGIVKISKKLLEEVIPLPEGAKILGCDQSNPRDGALVLYVEGNGIPPREEGEICPEVSLEVTRHEDKSLTSKFVA